MESINDIKVDDEGLFMIVVDHENDKKNHSTVKQELKIENNASDNILSDTEVYAEYVEDQDKNVEVKLEVEHYSDEIYEDETYLEDDSDYDPDESCEPEYKNVEVKLEVERYSDEIYEDETYLEDDSDYDPDESCEPEYKNVEVKLEVEHYSDEIYEDETYLEDDSDYDPDESCEPEYINIKCKKKRKEWQKFKLRGPEEQQSYVNELRKKYPELKKNEQLLIDKLYQRMLQMKPPDPPKDYFLMNDIFYECAECGAKKETVPAVSRHWQQHHGPRYAFCFACGDDFRNVTNLYRHEKRCFAPDAVLVLKARARVLGRKGRGRPFIPEDLPPSKKKKPVGGFPCNECGAVFKFSRSLPAHQAAAHAGLRPYRCDACPAAYSKPLSLYKHRREKHLNEPHPCDTCGRTFSSKYNLKLHTDSHQNVRRFPCAHCDKRYAKNRSLRIHMEREHLNLPPPFACHCCPKRYYRIEELKAHMLKLHGMNLISRNSFMKSLPKLSNSVIQLMENANKSELSSQPDQNNIVIIEENSEISDSVEMKITDEITQCPELNEPGKQTDSTTVNEVVKVENEKVFDFSKCTEKFESGSEIEQQEPIEIQLIEDDGNNNTENETSKDYHDDRVIQVSKEQQDNNTPEDLLEYAENLQQENSNKPKPLIVIKDGQAVFMDKNNVDFFKRTTRKRKNTKTEVFIKDLKADVESIIQHSTPDTFDSNNPVSQEIKEEITKTKRTVSKKKCVSNKVQEVCHSKMKAKKKQRRK